MSAARAARDTPSICRSVSRPRRSSCDDSTRCRDLARIGR